MPRRLVTSEIWFNEKFHKFPDKAKLFFIGLITNADDDGRLKGSAPYLRSRIFPYDDIPSADIEAWLQVIIDAKFATTYDIDGNRFVYLTGWKEHQSIRSDRYRASEIPPPPVSIQDGIPSGIQDGIPDVKIREDKISKDKISSKGLVTNKDTNVDTNVDTNGSIFKIFEENYQKLTDIVVTQLNGLIDYYGSEKVLYGIQEGIKYNKRNIRYVEGVCKGNGHKPDSTKTGRLPMTYKAVN